MQKPLGGNILGAAAPSQKGNCPDDQDCPLGKESLTLCIAAECRHENKWAVVHCADTRQEKGGIFQELVGSEDAFKIAKIGPPDKLFHVMISGIPTKALDLMYSCKGAVAEIIGSPGAEDSDLEMTQYMQALKKQAATKKKQIIDHHLQMNLGIALQEFLDTAAKRFTADHYNQLWSEIRNLDLGCELIFTGYHGCGTETNSIDSHLIRLDRFGGVHWENGYSVTGIGSDIALAFLCQRDYDPFGVQLMECLFRVAEAKKAAERNRHVGIETAIVITIGETGRFRLSPLGWQAIMQAVGTKKVLAFDANFLHAGT